MEAPGPTSSPSRPQDPGLMEMRREAKGRPGSSALRAFPLLGCFFQSGLSRAGQRWGQGGGNAKCFLVFVVFYCGPKKDTVMGHKLERSGMGTWQGHWCVWAGPLCILQGKLDFSSLGFLKAIYEAELIQPSCATISKQGVLWKSGAPLSPLSLCLHSHSILSVQEGMRCEGQAGAVEAESRTRPYWSSLSTLASLPWTSGWAHRTESGCLLLYFLTG